MTGGLWHSEHWVELTEGCRYPSTRQLVTLWQLAQVSPNNPWCGSRIEWQLAQSRPAVPAFLATAGIPIGCFQTFGSNNAGWFMRARLRPPSCSTWHDVHSATVAWNWVDCLPPKSCPAWQLRQVFVSTPFSGVWQVVH